MEATAQTSSQELELEMGRGYRIESPPSKPGNAKYLGCKDFGDGPLEVFANEDSVILARKYELEQKENGVIIYMPGRHCTRGIPRDVAMEMDDLAEMLQDSEGGKK